MHNGWEDPGVSDQMRIAFINLSIEPYPPTDAQAISTCIQQTAQALRPLGHDVIILSRASGQPIYGSDVRTIPNATGSRSRLLQKARHLESRFRGLDWPGQADFLRNVRKALSRELSPPDAFIVANDFHVPKLLKRHYPGRPVLLWLHNEQRTNHRHPEEAFRTVDKIVAVSGSIRNWALRNFPITEDQVAVVHNGVNLDEFRPRQNFTMSAARPRVLFVGRIDEGKGPDILLSAVDRLALQGVYVTVTLVGGRQRFQGNASGADAYVQDVLRALDSLGGTSLGPVPRSDLPAVMREHDIVCIPSRANEAFSLVALEAMASGCAVVASDRGGLPEACGGAALHFDPATEDAAEIALGSVLREPKLLRFYKEQAVQRARDKSWSATADAFAELLLSQQTIG